MPDEVAHYSSRMNNTETSSSNQSSSSDCLSCRLVSFLGLTGSGAYVAYHGRKQQGIVGKCVVTTFAVGLVYVGMARLINIYPFGRRPESVQSQ